MTDHLPMTTRDRRVVWDETQYVTVLQDTATPTAWVAAAEPVPIRR